MKHRPFRTFANFREKINLALNILNFISHDTFSFFQTSIIYFVLMLQKFNYQLFRQIPPPKHNLDYFICLVADSILIISFVKFYIQICEYLHGKFSQIKYLTFTTTITQLTQPTTHPRKDARAGVHNYPMYKSFQMKYISFFLFSS